MIEDETDFWKNEGEPRMKFKLYTGAALLLTIMTTCSCERIALALREPGDKYLDAADNYFFFQQYALAEENYRLSIDYFEREGRRIQRIYNCLAQVYELQGRYKDAVVFRERGYQPNKDRLSLSEHYYHYADCGDSHFTRGDYSAALKCYETANEFSERNCRSRQDYRYSYIAIYPSLSNYYMQQGNYEKAIQLLKEGLDIGLHKNDANFDWIARERYFLARAYYYSGDETAIETMFHPDFAKNMMMTACTTSYPEDVVGGATIVGRILEHRGENSKTLAVYQDTLKNLRSFEKDSKLMYRMEMADVLSLIGGFYVKQGQPTEAAQAYCEAITLRQATGTATHPNCADAIKGLADVSAAKGELTSATLQAAQALKILDTALVPTHPRIAPELVALASIHVLAGRSEQATPLNARLETILQKPLGPWREDFMETTKFYAGLLKKAGKTEETGRLEWLQPRK